MLGQKVNCRLGVMEQNVVRLKHSFQSFNLIKVCYLNVKNCFWSCTQIQVTAVTLVACDFAVKDRFLLSAALACATGLF